MTVVPCQCGARSEPDIVRVRYTAEQGAWQVRCLRCKASSSARDSQADAVNAWNRLALAVQIADAGKRCEEELDGSRKWGNFRQELRRLLEQWEVDDDDDVGA